MGSGEHFISKTLIEQSSTEDKLTQTNNINRGLKWKSLGENDTISGAGQVSVAGSCRQENKPSRFIKCEDLLNH